MDPSIRWDAEALEPEDLVEISVMRDSPVAGIHGFVLNDACWKVLQKANGGPAGVSLDRLLCVCESLPFPLGLNGVSWGYDYGRLLKHETGDQYPWLE